MNPIILIHGALGAHSQLVPLGNELKAEHKPVFYLDLSGHGGRPFRPGCFGIEAFAEDLDQFIEMNEMAGADVFGYSMGGYVALWLALQPSNKLRKIITLGSKFNWDPMSAKREVEKLDPQKILQKVPAFARILEHRHHPHGWKELIMKTNEMMIGLGNHPLLTLENAKQIKSETLVLLGDRDDMADLTFSKQFALALPNGQFTLLKETPHPIEKIDIRLLASLVLDFTKA